MSQNLFTSESVTEGHPDKMCDRISDSILDACLARDAQARVACETFVKGFHDRTRLIIGGEISLDKQIIRKGLIPDYEEIARQAARDIGYTNQAWGMDADRADVELCITTQSADIRQGVDNGLDQGAGDQGLMFGYATDETASLMPLPIDLAHRLAHRLSTVRKEGILPWVLPDGKTQVSVRYVDGQPRSVETVVVSTQHLDGLGRAKPRGRSQSAFDEEVLAQVREGVIDHVINPVVPPDWRAKGMTIHVNPTGKFVIGGPHGDAGLTGRKIFFDTYGGMGRHGGGAFSGKDPSKVDRSAAYACRWVAKHLVRAGLARRCEIQVAYAIGVAEPVSINVNSFGTSQVKDEQLVKLVRRHVDLRPAAMIERLGLLSPIYAATSAYGHFGREEFPWEQVDEGLLKKLSR
ncbi:MAG: methionine adenosyltransferase [bacterium]|nr:methionine adenosyltransferase [bacterium]